MTRATLTSVSWLPLRRIIARGLFIGSNSPGRNVTTGWYPSAARIVSLRLFRATGSSCRGPLKRSTTTSPVAAAAQAADKVANWFGPDPTGSTTSTPSPAPFCALSAGDSEALREAELGAGLTSFEGACGGFTEATAASPGTTDSGPGASGPGMSGRTPPGDGGTLVAATDAGEGIVSDGDTPAALPGASDAELEPAGLSADGTTRESFWGREAEPESACATVPAAASPGPAPWSSTFAAVRGSGGLINSSFALPIQSAAGSSGPGGEDQRTFKTPTATARTATGAIQGRCRCNMDKGGWTPGTQLLSPGAAGRRPNCSAKRTRASMSCCAV